MTVIDEVVKDMLAKDLSVEALGVEVRSAAAGLATLRMTVAPSAANGHGICHGGIIYYLADTAFALAVNSLMPGTATSGASIEYYSPVPVGEVLVAEARVRHAARRRSLVDVTVRCGDRVVAEYRGKGALLPKPTLLSKPTP